jgi:hypothetical protein
MDFSEHDFWDPPKKRPKSPGGEAARASTGSNPAARPLGQQREVEQGQTDKPQVTDDDEELQEVVRGAPPWLMSMAMHLLVVLVLGGISAWQLVRSPTTEVVARFDNSDLAPPDVFAEQLGVQIKDPNSTSEGDPNQGDQTIITPQDPSLPMVPDAFAAPPTLADLMPGGSTVTSTFDAPEIGLALSGRTHGRMKNVLLGKFGGNKVTEDAVKLGLAWLAKNQLKEAGNWSLMRPFTNGGESDNPLAATGLALIAFQGSGNTHKEGDFQKNVSRGIEWIIKNQEKDGSFNTFGESNQRLYSQAIGTIALCELYGMTHDSHLREPAEKAVKYAVRIQSKEGGWRYVPMEQADVSVTGWFVIALQSAKMAGMDVPNETFDRISSFLDGTALSDGRQYGYQIDRKMQTNALSAEGLLCREYLGWKQNDPRLKEGVAEFIKHPVNYDIGATNVYYWYYATQAAHHLEGETWDKWNATMRQEVPAHQTKNGPEAGSWPPTGDEWGSSGGRLYTTCLSIFMLEVYYRHLPIYSGYKLFKPGGVPPENPGE